MEKKVLLLSAIIILIILIFGVYFYFNYNQPQNIPLNTIENVKIINYSIECNKGCKTNPEFCYVYPGARAFTHGGDPPCNHVYLESVFNNNSNICDYLEADIPKAICIGSSAKDASSKEECDQINKKDLCMLNFANKVYRMKIKISSEELKNSCDSIENISFKAKCYGFISTEFNKPEECNQFSGESRFGCLREFIEINKAELQTPLITVSESNKELVLKNMNLCNTLFTDSQERIYCYWVTNPNFDIYKFDNSTRANNPYEVYGTISYWTYYEYLT